jgi:DNA-binding response OmpR family regulator
MKKRILVIEDDRALGRILVDNLTFEGFDVVCVTNGAAALNHVRAERPDLVILDIMLPDTDGFRLCGVLRQSGHLPIIMLTARGQKTDKLRGLDLGADDYITKPFDLEELLARVRAVLRRTGTTVDRLVLGSVTIDFATQQATNNNHAFHLTDREFEVLRFLAERQDRLVSRTELLREVWGYLDAPPTRSVDHAIARIRKKIEADAGHPRFIHTVHGGGYRLTPGGPSSVVIDEPQPHEA